jgi:subtilisin family serine protease
MRVKIILMLVLLLCPGISPVRGEMLYRLILTDKGSSPYRIDKPGAFLSPKSIARRIRQGFPVDETDLPISPDYFNAVSETGASVLTYSKWVQTIVVSAPEEETVELLNELPFVSEVYPVGESVHNRQFSPNEMILAGQMSFSFLVPAFYPEFYGNSFTQISLHNGHLLHDAGYKGNGVTIAVLDAGFWDADRVACFDFGQVLEVKNFTHESGNPLRSTVDHGTRVLSCMLACLPQEMTGTAPEAAYCLFKTEVNESEFPVEEDYWVAAVEYADSLGVDIVSTSLGYSLFFSNPAWNHTHSELDGHTVPASRAASMAAYKGIILCNAAGNEGGNEWNKIGFPSDAEHILTVGAIAGDSTLAPFSSRGYSSDGRVKPDVVAMGVNTTVCGHNGWISAGNGTSFACPVISGLVACLWQALPELNSLELMDLIRQSADRYQHPDSGFGYGIPDFFQAYSFGKNRPSHLCELIASPEGNRIYIRNSDYTHARMSIYTGMGSKVLETPVSSFCIDTSHLHKGFYIAILQQDSTHTICKFIKR